MTVPYNAFTSHRDEWRIWQGREDVILRSRTAIATYDAFRIEATEDGAKGGAKRRALTYKELIASEGVYTHNNLVWLIPAENLPDAIEPRIGDRVLDSGDFEYTILEVQKGKFGETHRCITICLKLVEDLRDEATIRRPADIKDEGGRPALSTYAILYEHVPCRLQPKESVRGEALGRTTSPHKFIAYVDLPIEVLRARDALEVAGQRYTIDRLGEVARLDRLPEIECTLLD